MANQNVKVRRVAPEDDSALHDLHSQQHAVWGTIQMPYQSTEPWKQSLALQSDSQFGLVACVDGMVVGHVVLAIDTRSPRRRHVGELGGMAVHEDWLSQGIGSALMRSAINLADKWLNLFRLELIVFVDNVSALRLYEKVGFNIEGRLRDFSFRDGEYADAYIMGRLRPRADRSTRV